MTYQTINVVSKVKIPVAMGCCTQVTLCLNDTWAGYTVSGLPLLTATLENTGRMLSSGHYNSRCVDVYIYRVKVDDTQILTDENTRLPYVLECEDVIEVIPYNCVFQSIIYYIQQYLSPAGMLCLPPLTDWPANPSQNCIVNIVGWTGAGQVEDGLYYYVGDDNWAMLGSSPQ